MSVSEFTPPPRTLFGVVRKYWRILQISLMERLAYRADWMLTTFLRFLPMVTTILLWTAIYTGAASERGKGIGSVELAGFSINAMISYLLLVHISRMFSSMPGLAGSIARDIREGTLKKYLLQPLDMLSYLVFYRMAHKVAYMVSVAVPYTVIFFLCRDYFTETGWPHLSILAAYIVSLFLAFIIGFHFEACMGMIGFWFLEVSSLLYIINMLNYFVSGHMFPIDLLPSPWPEVLKVLPFQYLAYFPAAVFLGKVQGAELTRGLIIEVAWAVGLVVMARWLYHRGLRRYSAYGG